MKKRVKKTLLLLVKIGLAVGLLTWLVLPSTAFRRGQIRDWQALCSELVAKRGERGAYERIWQSLSPRARQAVEKGADEDAELPPEDKEAIVTSLNGLLGERGFHRPGDFEGIRLDAEAKALVRRDPEALSEGRVRRLNRVLVEAAFPAAVAKSRKLDPYELADALRHHPHWMVLAFVIYNCCIVLTGIRWRMLLAAQDIHARRRDCVMMNYIGLFFSTFLPGATGGDFVKAYYVARDREKKAEAVTTVFLDRVFGLYCMILYGTVAILFHFNHLWHYESEAGAGGLTQAQFLIVLVLTAFAAATVGLAVVLNPHCRRLTHFLLDRLPVGGEVLKRVYEAVYLYRGRPGLLAKFLGFSVAAHSLGALSVLCVGYALGDPVAHGGARALNYLFLVPLGLVINGLPLTPAGLGAFEAAEAWLFKTVGSNMGANVAALGHVVFLLTNQVGLIFYLRGKRQVAAAQQAAAAAQQADAPPGPSAALDPT